MAISRNWKNLRDAIRKTYNREVNEWFRDVDDPIPDNSTPRKQLKRACLILPTDSQNIVNIKMQYFRHTVQQVHLWNTSYGMPIDDYQEKVTFRPQVHLFFRQDASATTRGRRAIEGQISFRLMSETSQTMTEAKARILATKIKREFTTANGYMWKKGNKKYTYKDVPEGIDLRILSISEIEGKEVIRKVLDVQDILYDENKFQEIIPKRDSENNPVTTQRVYGKERKKPRWRPTANLRFRFATLTVHGMQNRIVLVDRTFTFFSALELV